MQIIAFLDSFGNWNAAGPNDNNRLHVHWRWQLLPKFVEKTLRIEEKEDTAKK